ncbi:MAG: FliI/YscN family ATPase [Hydrocarboniphaga sp.]|uniref:flagellar protein export ATPase FliI n=1 Tax=Hydrocarboniphaga sp. TaxID=2033016 RepID=UPI0026247EF3|nr:flagellar protein export ATPase FliI [Hydrocarboniphaga sp.]MDB5969842.1 FliI/YscN family ATPase [Hydrocarboniphaga sp.]
MKASPRANRDLKLVSALRNARSRVADAHTVVVEGLLKRVTGLTLEAVGCQVRLGSRVSVLNADGGAVEAEVVGFNGDRTYLMPIGDLRGVQANARVVPLAKTVTVPVGDGLLGRVLDGEGRPLDDIGRLVCDRASVGNTPINPLRREPITDVLDTGVRAINALLTVGRGQRLGLFAGTGVGKSTLLGMMTRYTNADVIVVGLVGERGREVRDFLDHSLGVEGRRRAVVVATPADRSPMQRLRGAWLATSIAESFRDRGKNVLLLMDSLTRVAQAQREIGLAIGEPPTTRGYPPSVFALIPKMVERAGNGTGGGGSITAFYTVLTEGDDPNDPIADTARGVLDGHILLSRSIAESGVFPAIDVEASISRVMQSIVAPEHQQLARRFRALVSTYQRNRDLIAIGAYQRGADPRVDEALALWPRIEAFLRQDVNEGADTQASRKALAGIFNS